jgi:hypothetical protein
VSTFIITRRVQEDPAVAADRFEGDPATWLPQPVTEHGAHEFRATVRAWWRIPLVFTVGGVWQRGKARTRRFSVMAPRDEGLSMFRCITGELTTMNGHGTTTLRFTASDRGHEGRLARLLPSSAQAQVAARTIIRHIAANLAEPGEPAHPTVTPSNRPAP